MASRTRDLPIQHLKLYRLLEIDTTLKIVSTASDIHWVFLLYCRFVFKVLKVFALNLAHREDEVTVGALLMFSDMARQLL